jgi:DNA-3-methyladenine glycosylase
MPIWFQDIKCLSVQTHTGQTGMKPDRMFFDRNVVDVARDLVGMSFRIHSVGGIIVETEAYGLEDAAAHSFMGKTVRNSSMFGPPGCVYVYRSYGLHWCINIVCQTGCAVLIRALEPKYKIEIMSERRQTSNLKLLCSGPGRLTQALAINGQHDGQDIFALPFEIDGCQSPDVVSGPRIGITKAVNLPWRFGIRDSPFLSRKFADNIPIKPKT